MTKLSMVTKKGNRKVILFIKNRQQKTYEEVRKSRIYNGAFRNDIPGYSYPT